MGMYPPQKSKNNIITQSKNQKINNLQRNLSNKSRSHSKSQATIRIMFFKIESLVLLERMVTKTKKKIDLTISLFIVLIIEIIKYKPTSSCAVAVMVNLAWRLKADWGTNHQTIKVLIFADKLSSTKTNSHSKPEMGQGRERDPKLKTIKIERISSKNKDKNNVSGKLSKLGKVSKASFS